MTNIAIIGFGLMGRVHLRSYLVDGRANVLAVADPNPRAMDSDEVRGNLKEIERSANFDASALRHETAVEAVLDDDSIDAVSICNPTGEHVGTVIAALEAGKHVLVEKPLGLNFEESATAVAAANDHPNLIAMPAMCMRFWPAWKWLRDRVHDGRFGRVRSATFTRMGVMPTWASFYRDADQSGGAILDLHIHDADFVRYCFGNPRMVESTGYSETTKGIDHVVTRYGFDRGPDIVVAEGGWTMKPGFEFTMRYLVNFEHASATFNLSSEPQLKVTLDQAGDVGKLPAGEGYPAEISYFLDCIEQKRRPQIVTMQDGAEAVRLIEAERESVRLGQPVAFDQGEPNAE